MQPVLQFNQSNKSLPLPHLVQLDVDLHLVEDLELLILLSGNFVDAFIVATQVIPGRQSRMGLEVAPSSRPYWQRMVASCHHHTRVPLKSSSRKNEQP